MDLLAAGIPADRADRSDPTGTEDQTAGTHERTQMNDGVWSGSLGRRAARRRARRATTELRGAAGARPAPQPQAGASAGLERARQARAAVARRGVRRRASRSASRVRELLGDDGGRGARSSSATRRRPPGSATRSPTALGLAPYLHSTRRPVDGRRAARAASRSPTRTPPRTCCCRRTRRCWPATGRWSSSTTSSPPATPSSTPSATCTSATRASATWSSPWSTCARPADRGRLDDVRRARSARASTWWPLAAGTVRLPGRRAGEGAGAGRASTRAADAPEPAADAGRRARRRAAPYASSSAGPPGCPTAAGTASPPRTAHGWRRALPAMAAPPRRGAARPTARPRARPRLRGADVRAAARSRDALEQAGDGAEVALLHHHPLARPRRRRPRLRDPHPPRLPRPRRPGRRPRRALRLQRRRRAGFDAVVAVVDSAADTPALHAPDGLLAALAAHTAAASLLAVVPRRTSPTTPPTPDAARKALHAARAPARPRLLLLRPRRGRLAAPGPLRRDAGGADRGARGGHPERAARTTPSRCRSSTSRATQYQAAVPRALDDLRRPDRAGRRRRHRDRARRARRRGPGAWSRWPAPARPSAS